MVAHLAHQRLPAQQVETPRLVPLLLPAAVEVASLSKTTPVPVVLAVVAGFLPPLLPLRAALAHQIKVMRAAPVVVETTPRPTAAAAVVVLVQLARQATAGQAVTASPVLLPAQAFPELAAAVVAIRRPPPVPVVLAVVVLVAAKAPP